MTNAVISAVESMAEKEGQPLIKGGVPLFEWRPNAPVEDTLEEDVTSTDNPVFIIEDVFEIPGDDADANLSDNVENGPNDDVLRMHLRTTLSTVTTSLKPMIPLVLSLTVLSLAPTTKTNDYWRRR